MRQVRGRRQAPPDLLWGPPADAVPRDPEIERRIAEDPDDVARLSVYADFLAEQGDPRGEVLAAWCRCDQAPDAELETAIQRWQYFYASVLTPGGFTAQAVSTHRGPLLDAWNAAGFVGTPDLAGVLGSPMAVALRQVSAELLFRGDPAVWIEAVRRRERPSALRSLHLNWNWLRGAGTRTWWPAFDGLDEVRLEGNLEPLGRIEVPGLRSLAIRSPVLPVVIDALEAPRLERLDLQIPRTADPNALIAVVGALPRLTQLTLAGLDPLGAEALLRQPLATRVEQLTLSDSTSALNAVAAHQAGLPVLRRLVVIEPEQSRTPDPIRRRVEAAFGDRVTFVASKR